MITAPDIQRLLHNETEGKPIVSVFLDLSVNSENKRTHGVFLSRQRTHFEHPALERNGKRRSLETTLDRVERWLADEFDEATLQKLRDIGCDSAKAVLELSIDELVRRSGLEPELAERVVASIKTEFADEEQELEG